jgi:hypothetical protein
MLWVLKAFTVEQINLVRHDLNSNNDRSIRRGPVRCGRKDKVILKNDRESYNYFANRYLYLYLF